MYAQIHNGAYVAQAPHAYATAPVSATVATNGWPTGMHNVNPYNMAAMAYNPSVAYPGLPAPPAPPGVNLQHWQNGRWAYNVPQQSQQVYNAKPTGPAAVAAAASAALAATYPPPTMVGWTVPASWGVPAQYYHPSALPQKQRDPSYWNTQLTDNGLMLENMHISRPKTSGEGDDKSDTVKQHTPWVWVPSLPDEDSPDSPDSSSSSQREMNSTSARTQAPAQAANHAQGPPPAVARPSIPSQPSKEPETPDMSVEDPAQRRARETAPRMYASNPTSSSSSQTAQHQSSTRATAHLSSASTRPVPSPHVTAPVTSSAVAHTHARDLQRSHTLPAPMPSRPGEREREDSFTEVKALRTTFSPAIIRTPGHYRYPDQDTPRASVSANPQPAPNGTSTRELQRSQTMPDVNYSAPGSASASSARHNSVPAALGQGGGRDRDGEKVKPPKPVVSTMFEKLAHFAEEPESILSPLVDNNPSLFSAPSDGSESSGSSTVSVSTVREGRNGTTSSGRQSSVSRERSVGRAERVKEWERVQERQRQSSGGSLREHDRDKGRAHDRDREREQAHSQYYGQEKRHGETGENSHQPSRSLTYPIVNNFYSTPTNVAPMDRSISHSSSIGTSPNSSQRSSSPAHSSLRGTSSSRQSTPSSSHHGTPSSIRTSSSRSSNPPSLQPSPNRTHFPATSPYYQVQQQPSSVSQHAASHSQPQHSTSHAVVPSPNVQPVQSPAKYAASSPHHSHSTSMNHASAQVNSSTAGYSHAQASQITLPRATRASAQTSQAAANYASAHVNTTPSRPQHQSSSSRAANDQPTSHSSVRANDYSSTHVTSQGQDREVAYKPISTASAATVTYSRQHTSTSQQPSLVKQSSTSPSKYPSTASASHQASQYHHSSTQQVFPLSQRYHHGYWNRRGDYLTKDGFIIKAPAHRMNPPELADYPTTGFRNYHGTIANHPRYTEYPNPYDYDTYIANLPIPKP